MSKQKAKRSLKSSKLKTAPCLCRELKSRWRAEAREEGRSNEEERLALGESTQDYYDSPGLMSYEESDVCSKCGMEWQISVSWALPPVVTFTTCESLKEEWRAYEKELEEARKDAILAFDYPPVDLYKPKKTTEKVPKSVKA